MGPSTAQHAVMAEVEVVVVAMVKVATAEMVMVVVERVTPSRGAFDNSI